MNQIKEVKTVRITIEAVAPDGTVTFASVNQVSLLQLAAARYPMLPLIANQCGDKFWQAVVMMGALDG